MAFPHNSKGDGDVFVWNWKFANDNDDGTERKKRGENELCTSQIYVDKVDKSTGTYSM